MTEGYKKAIIIHMKSFSYVDFFSGIGGFRIALDSLGGKSSGYSEIDKHAIATYQLNFNDPEDHNLGDITKITKKLNADLFVGGVPCQSWSVAGKRMGFEDPRGKLWFDTIELVRKNLPKVFIFENVKGLADPRNKKNLDLITKSFEEIGYRVSHKILNAFDFKCPQNRSRIFIVGFRNDMESFASKFNFPKPQKHDFQIVDYLDGIKKETFKKEKFSAEALYENGKIPLSRNAFQMEDELNDFFTLCDTRNGHSTIHSWDIVATTNNEKEICMAILKNRRKKKYGNFDGNPLSLLDISEILKRDIKKADVESLVSKRILRFTKDNKVELVNSKNSAGIGGIYRVYLPNSPIFSTLTATGTKDYVTTKYISARNVKEYREKFIEEIIKKKNLRQITAQEALKIQGFPKDFKAHKNDTHMHKQVGNSVSPLVVKALTQEIIKTGIFN